MKRGWWAVAVLCGGLVLTAAAATRKDRAVGLGVGYRPPEFTASDLNGTRRSLEQNGQVVVLHFWASWCPFCRSEIPELTELHREWVSKGVRVLTVSTDEDVATLKQFVAQQGLSYPVIADAQAKDSVAEQYAISGIPVTYIIGRDGLIAQRLNGASEIIEAVKRTLAQPSSA